MAETRPCAKCGEDKTLDNYTACELARNKGRCRACVAERGRAWYERNKEKAKEGARRRAPLYAHKQAARMRKRRYGLTEEQHAELLLKQDGRCALCCCVSNNTLHVDHCHETGVVRGLLCGPCNRALGLLKDDSTLMRRAADYVERK